MSTNKNITMHQYNGVDYDTLYPKTTASQVIGLEDISSTKVYTATISTAWTENDDGTKTQTVSIPAITTTNTAIVDHSQDNITDYEAYVAAENQYLTNITNGFAQTVAGGITFTIFGDANTVAIPIVVEVV